MVVFSDDVIFICGYTDNEGFVIKWDGSSWSLLTKIPHTFNAEMPVTENKDIFIIYLMMEAPNLSKWDGSSLQKLIDEEPRFSEYYTVRSLISYKNNFYAIETVSPKGNPHAYKHTLVKYFKNSWIPTLKDPAEVYEFKITNEGQMFTVVNINDNAYIAKLENDKWVPLGDKVVNYSFDILTTKDGTLIAAGAFYVGHKLNWNGVAKWNGSSWVSGKSPVNFK